MMNATNLEKLKILVANLSDIDNEPERNDFLNSKLDKLFKIDKKMTLGEFFEQLCSHELTYGFNEAVVVKQDEKKYLLDNGEQPVSLTLVFGIKEMMTLQELTKETLHTAAPLLRQYEWYWYGATNKKQTPYKDESRQSNMCWLTLDLADHASPTKVLRSLEVAEIIKGLSQGTLAFNSFSVSPVGFNLESSLLKTRGYIKK